MPEHASFSLRHTPYAHRPRSSSTPPSPDQAYRGVDAAASGRLTSVVWACETARVLGVAFPFLTQRVALVGSVVGGDGGDVDYGHFLGR